jgi:hypothetical protein
MKTKKILTGLCLLNGITISTLANSQVSIDLANDDGKTLAKPSASSVTVTIKNMLPTAGYSKYIKHYYPEIAGLPKPDMSNIPGAPALGVKVASQPSEDMDDNAGIMEGKSLFGGVEKAAGDGISPDEIAPLVVDYLSTNIKNECYALFSKSISDVYAADSEKALSSEVDKLNATLKSYSARVKGDYYRTVESIVGNIIDNNVKANEIASEVKKEIAKLHNYNWLNNSLECTELFNQAVNTLDSSQEKVTINFYEGKSASLEITRNYNGTQKSWLYRWEEEPPTVWLYNLSYVFIRDFDNDAYYTESFNTEDETFLIRKYSDSGFEYMPAAMFTYVFEPDEYRINGNSWGASAGISLDPDKPGILGGVSYIVGQNVTVTAGVAITQQDVLKGEYKAYSKSAEFTDDMPPQTIDSALSADQLVKDTYKGSWFLAIGFTFE